MPFNPHSAGRNPQSTASRVVAMVGDSGDDIDVLARAAGWPVVEVSGMVQLTQLAQARRLAAVVYFGGRKTGVREADRAHRRKLVRYRGVHRRGWVP